MANNMPMIDSRREGAGQLTGDSGQLTVGTEEMEQTED